MIESGVLTIAYKADAKLKKILDDPQRVQARTDLLLKLKRSIETVLDSHIIIIESDDVEVDNMKCTIVDAQFDYGLIGE